MKVEREIDTGSVNTRNKERKRRIGPMAGAGSILFLDLILFASSNIFALFEK